MTRIQMRIFNTKKILNIANNFEDINTDWKFYFQSKSVKAGIKAFSFTQNTTQQMYLKAHSHEVTGRCALLNEWENQERWQYTGPIK